MVRRQLVAHGFLSTYDDLLNSMCHTDHRYTDQQDGCLRRSRATAITHDTTRSPGVLFGSPCSHATAIVAICGYPAAPVVANTVDHIVEVEKGGSDDPRNLKAVCPQCHNRRHAEKGHLERI